MEQQAAVPAHVAMGRLRPKPKAVKVEVLRDGKSSEAISFVHGPGARNTEGLNQKMVGSANAGFETAGIENLTPASAAPLAIAEAPAAPLARTTASARRNRHAAHAQSPSGEGFSGAPADNPFFAGPNSKTIDVP